MGVFNLLESSTIWLLVVPICASISKRALSNRTFNKWLTVFSVLGCSSSLGWLACACSSSAMRSFCCAIMAFASLISWVRLASCAGVAVSSGVRGVNIFSTSGIATFFWQSKSLTILLLIVIMH